MEHPLVDTACPENSRDLLKPEPLILQTHAIVHVYVLLLPYPNPFPCTFSAETTDKLN